jgi:hypothetical protein
MTAGISSLGVLLWTRHRLRASEGPLRSGPGPSARQAGHTVLILSGAIAVLVAAIVVARLHDGGGVSVLSLGLPLAGLVWLASIGLRTRGHAETAEELLPSTDRPSKRPPNWDALPGSKSDPASRSNRHVSA